MLDPIVAIRSTVVIDPDESVVVDIVTGIAASRDAALGLAEKYNDRNLADRVFDLAFTHGQVMLQHLNVSEPDAQLYGRLASAIVYSQTARRAPASLLFKNRRGQSGLWGYGISGDLPIVLLRISEVVRIDLVRQLVRRTDIGVPRDWRSTWSFGTKIIPAIGRSCTIRSWDWSRRRAKRRRSSGQAASSYAAPTRCRTRIAF